MLLAFIFVQKNTNTVDNSSDNDDSHERQQS